MTSIWVMKHKILLPVCGKFSGSFPQPPTTVRLKFPLKLTILKKSLRKVSKMSQVRSRKWIILSTRIALSESLARRLKTAFSSLSTKDFSLFSTRRGNSGNHNHRGFDFPAEQVFAFFEIIWNLCRFPPSQCYFMKTTFITSKYFWIFLSLLWLFSEKL